MRCAQEKAALDSIDYQCLYATLSTFPTTDSAEETSLLTEPGTQNCLEVACLQLHLPYTFPSIRNPGAHDRTSIQRIAHQNIPPLSFGAIA
tara:strand:+ start:760 stop:1032 length:273 start_codon:yes stop_codon:yes gene_type:complete